MKHPWFMALSMAALVAGSASSAVLTLDCRVRSSKPGYQRAGIRRLQIDFAAKTVAVSDNTGRGFVRRGVRPLVSADSQRIVLEQGGGKASSVDRRSGRYVFRNEAEKLSIEGRCAPAAVVQPR